MVPHLQERPATRKRWPDGVSPGANGKAPIVFFNKDLAKGTPDWVARHKIAHKDHDNYYPVINDLATLTWLAQLASLEIHVPQWRFGRNGQPRNPDRLVLDLDPGPGVSLTDCAEIALLVRDILRDIGHDPVPVTSGSKGIHLYAPLDGSLSSEQATEVARELALALEADHRDRVISSMKRSDRDGKVFIDWSQNNGAKTTVSPYSLRGRDHPMVAAPRTLGGDRPRRICTQLDYTEVASRLSELGDPLAAMAGRGCAGRTGSPRTAACGTRRRPRSRCRREPAREDQEGFSFVIQEHHARRPALRLPAGAARGAGQLGGAQGSADRSQGQSPGGADRRSSAGVRLVRGQHPPGRVRRRRGAASGTPGPTSCTSGARARRSSSPCSASRTAVWAACASLP